MPATRDPVIDPEAGGEPLRGLGGIDQPEPVHTSRVCSQAEYDTPTGKLQGLCDAVSLPGTSDRVIADFRTRIGKHPYFIMCGQGRVSNQSLRAEGTDVTEQLDGATAVPIKGPLNFRCVFAGVDLKEQSKF
ncbi:hypothetical protein BMS3Bbin02_00288 [bacterium BMS3Bbin02]|nr:hypothetical protein BMS3Bbin02_00288 [bacterium BMS3Bbin02]